MSNALFKTTLPQALAADLNLLLEAEVLRQLDAKVAEFLLEQFPHITAEQALLGALVSAQQAAGHLCLDMADQGVYERLFTVEVQQGKPELKAPQLLPKKVSQWRALVLDSPLVHGADSPLVLEGQRLYMRRHWEQERLVATIITQRLNEPPISVPTLAPLLNALFGEPTADTDWQRAACALAAQRRFAIITGGPGTGKTTTVLKLLVLLQQLALQQGAPLRIRLAAPTGKAAARLTESIREEIATLNVAEVREHLPTEVATIHRLLGSRPHSRHFRHNAGHPLPADLVVVDEASMVDMELMAALLQALAPQARLVLLGDKDQLASVEAGAIMGELCGEVSAKEANNYHQTTLNALQDAGVNGLEGVAPNPNASALAQHIVMLRKSYRFDASSGIGELARAVNNNDALYAKQLLAQGGVASTNHEQDLTYLSLKSHEVEATLPQLLLAPLHKQAQPWGLKTLFQLVNTPLEDEEAWARQCLRQLARQQLLSGQRRGPYGVVALNQMVEARLREEGLIEASLSRGDTSWYPGRPVMITRNDYQLKLMNGDVGITLKVGGKLRVAFELADGSIRWVSPQRLNQVETVYAMTVHKSQGSGFDHTVLLLPPHAGEVFTRELIYTAITRSKKHFTLITLNPEVFYHAMGRVTQRASGLWEKIMQQSST